jgi:hypothetical protein
MKQSKLNSLSIGAWFATQQNPAFYFKLMSKNPITYKVAGVKDAPLCEVTEAGGKKNVFVK